MPPLAYRSGGPRNESAYSNPHLDQLITAAEGKVDVVERRQIMSEIETLIVQKLIVNEKRTHANGPESASI